MYTALNILYLTPISITIPPEGPRVGKRAATMIGDSSLSSIAEDITDWQSTMDNGRGQNSLSVAVIEEGERRKRRLHDGESSGAVGGSRTPTLVSPDRKFLCGDVQTLCDDESGRPIKRFRGNSKIVSVRHSINHHRVQGQQGSEFLTKIPEDVVAHCLSYLGSVIDRFALQTTCKLFRYISNSDAMLAQVEVGGDLETGKLGIIQDSDTPTSAASALAPFARAGNLEALYM